MNVPVNMRALLLDDEPHHLLALRVACQRAFPGVTLVAAADAAQARAQIDAGEPFDLLISDWWLGDGQSAAPVLEGFTARFPDATAVVCSGDALACPPAEQAGASAFVLKRAAGLAEALADGYRAALAGEPVSCPDATRPGA